MQSCPRPRNLPPGSFYRSDDHFDARPNPWVQSPAGPRLPAGGFLVDSSPLQTEVRQVLPITPPKDPPPVDLFPSDKDLEDLLASGSENVPATVCSDKIAGSGDNDEVEKDSATHGPSQESVGKTSF